MWKKCLSRTKQKEKESVSEVELLKGCLYHLQACEIADLVMDYKEIMMYRTDSNNGSDLPSKESPPPMGHPNHVLTSVDVNETKL